MTEREPTAAPSWELAPIRDALSADWDSRSDPVLGDGVHYRLADPSTIELTCFPDTGLVRLATADMQIALAHLEPPVIDDRGVVFSRETDDMSTDLTIDREGSVTLLLTPAGLDMPFGAPDRPVDAPLSPKRPNTRDSAAQPAQDDAAAPETPPVTASEPVDDDLEKHPRVTLVGRLGAAPRFRTTPNDVLVGRFPLAVHHDDESTTWHPIVVFGERAVQVQSDELHKGELINVIGYEHERTWTDKNDQQRTEVQIYAAVITRS